jgi:hypothetical protein
MSTLRQSLFGLLAVLLALAAQLGVGATVPQPDPAVQVAGVALLCHPVDPGAPHTPVHLPACLLCPCCAAIHTPAPVPAATGAMEAPALRVAVRTTLPPPSRAPPVRARPPAQPRAPPMFS